MNRTTKFTYQGNELRVDTSQVKILLDEEATQWLMKMLAGAGCDEHDIKALLDSKSSMDLAKSILPVLLNEITNSKEDATMQLIFHKYPFLYENEQSNE